ncbi:hypothetical protein C2845_PM04G18620 [Panicum miliaceum]|uniref:Uncharacterized protein n=1 Tax=Panicum miliaceum TaxID=4540 RepID=A0A3L6QWU4_PANMI|nr:hypothetical protein C2845_PM04G18620 [Panicum miliaceum]
MESQSDVPHISELPEKRGGGRIPGLAKDVWVESKKLWVVAGPAAFTRLTFYGMTVVSQAFAGHIGDLELAAFSIAATVISGLSFGFFAGSVALYLLPLHFVYAIILPLNNLFASRGKGDPE